MRGGMLRLRRDDRFALVTAALSMTGGWGRVEKGEFRDAAGERRCRALPGWTAEGGCPHINLHLHKSLSAQVSIHMNLYPHSLYPHERLSKLAFDPMNCIA